MIPHKNYKKYCLLLLVTILFLILPTTMVFANDEGYYIENMSVDITVKENRSYWITETIDVYFQEERHGIIRTIPTSSSTEREITIDNVDVKNDPFIYDGAGTIKIGDADETIIGSKQYVISYSLSLYADYDLEADYFYMNIIGTEWDTKIERFNASIHFPETFEILDCSLTGGITGSKDTDYATHTVNHTTIDILGKKRLEPNEGITMMVSFPEGTFSEAKQWIPDLFIHNLDVAYELDDYGSIQVSKTYHATVNRGHIYTIEPKDMLGEYDVKMVDAKVQSSQDIPSAYGSNEISIDLRSYENQVVDFTVSYVLIYKINPSVTGTIFYANIFTFPSESTASVDAINGSFSLPFMVGEIEVKSGYYFNEDVIEYAEDTYQRFGDDYNISIEMKNQSNNARRYVVFLPMMESRFLRDSSIMEFVTPIVGIILCIVGIFLFHQKKTILNPTPEFYPPEKLNPTEIAFIMKGKIDTSDVLSLIYYWASIGCLKITSKSNNKFEFQQIKELPVNSSSYEKKLFQQIYKNIQNKTNGALYDAVENVKNEINSKYNENTPLFNQKVDKRIRLFSIIIPVCYFLLFVITEGSKGYGIYNSCIVIIVVVLLGYFIQHSTKSYNRAKIGNNSAATRMRIHYVLKLILPILVMIISLMLAYYGTIFQPISLIISIVCLLFVILLPFFLREYTPKGKVLIEKTMGFRLFLEVAEKDRLEMLLEENPDYYYTILPYTQVLGVSKIWMNKFKNIAIPRSSYMQGYRMEDEDDYLFYQRMTSSITQSVAVAKSSSDSSSSGSSYSDGGSSGGGAGGGGGSSW